MRKFTKVIRAVYEGDIERQMKKSEKKIKLNTAEVRVDMGAELDEEEAQGVVARQDQESHAFLKKHSKISKVSKSEIDEAVARHAKMPNVIRIATKRDAEEDLEEVEQAARPEKKHKQKKQRR